MECIYVKTLEESRMERRKGSGREIPVNAVVKGNNKYFAGPLNLNKKTGQATTVMGVELVLGEGDFEALDLFVSNEGRYLTFQQLYEAAWGKSEATDSIDFAAAALENLILHVNNVGEEFMWIDHAPGLGYALQTSWGNDWHKHGGVKLYTPSKPSHYTHTAIADESPHEHEQKPIRPLPLTIAAAAGVLMAAVIMVFLLLARTGMIAPAEAEPTYIELEDPRVPLGAPERED